MRTVLLLGTLDTKGDECRYVRDCLKTHGCAVVLMDVGILGAPTMTADVTREEVARAAGTTIEELVRQRDRGVAVRAMGDGAAKIVESLVDAQEASAVLALGGSGGASVAARAMARLPIGFPKLLVSPVAAGDTRPYVQGSDVAMLHPVVDLAGLNRMSRQVLANAAAAIAGMARGYEPGGGPEQAVPQIGMTMFGITTPCVELARRLLETKGFEALVFSANGVGGSSMERLMVEGLITGAIDVTTTELADRLVGGILPAGPERLRTAGALGLPQVISLGALDVVNFGPWETVPPVFRDRRLYRHNQQVTLMRTTPEECRELGEAIAARLSGGGGERCVVAPLRGFSALSTAGEPFYDPEADLALIEALRSELSSEVELIELDADINQPPVAEVLVERFAGAYRGWRKQTVKA